MTVDEVIIALSSFPPGTQAYLRDGLGRMMPVTGVFPMHIVTNPDPAPGEDMHKHAEGGDLSAFIEW